MYTSELQQVLSCAVQGLVIVGAFFVTGQGFLLLWFAHWPPFDLA